MIHDNCELNRDAGKQHSAKHIKQHTPGFLNLVSDTKSRITEISVSDLAKKLTGAPFYLIDVSEWDEYQQGAIPKAIHLSKGIIERDIEKRISDYQAEIVVYCSGGFRSCLVADNLKKMGYQHVIVLTGGLRAWLEAGYSILPPKII